MTGAILQQLAGMEKLEAIKVVVSVLHTLTMGMKGEDLPGIVPIAQRLVPVKKQRVDQFAQVWEYLETMSEYGTQKELRAELIARFGEKGTPSRSHLNRYLNANAGTIQGKEANR